MGKAPVRIDVLRFFVCGALLASMGAVDPVFANQSLVSSSSNKKVLSERALQCVQSASQYHRVNPQILVAIARVESRGNPLAVGRNSNGTLDVGLVQTNSIHFDDLVKKGVAPAHLQDECVSLYVGAWMLSKKMAKHGNTWAAIGAYHSETPQHNYKYQRLIYSELIAMGAIQ